MRYLVIILALLSFLCSSGCGGGGGGGLPVSNQKTAVLNLSLSDPGQKVTAISVTIALPEGVYVQTTDGVNVASGVVMFPTGGNSAGQLSTGKYTPAAGTTSGGTLKLDLVNLSYTTGVFVSVHALIQNGYTPARSGFTAILNGVWNSLGADISAGMTCTLDPVLP
jgi:hypothetical protein